MSKQRKIEVTESFADKTSAFNGATYDASDLDSISVQADVTETDTSGVTVTIQKSNDGVTWINAVTPVAISTDSTVWVADSAPNYRYFRVAFAVGAGEVDTANCHILGRG